MPLIRTTMTPTVPQIVSDATADDLRAQGALLENTRATTDEGLTEAALKQVRESSYSPATRAGIAEAGRRAAAAEKRRSPAGKRVRPSRARKPAPDSVAPGAAAPDAVTAPEIPAASAADPGKSAPADAVPDVRDDDAPADATTQES